MAAISANQSFKQHLFTREIYLSKDGARLFSTINSTLGNWDQVIQKRLAKTKNLNDARIGQLYQSLISDANSWAEGITTKVFPRSFVLMLKDLHDRVQAIAIVTADVTTETNRLFVETLFSAPWNVPLKEAPNDPDDQAKVVKGAGTTLMKRIYEHAIKQNINKVSVITFESSRSFYSEHLKMMPANKQLTEYYYDVAKDSIPEVFKTVL